MVAPLADTLTPMTDELTPTRRWQALVPELRSFTLQGQPSELDGQSAEYSPQMTDADRAAAKAADTAERLLLLVHYSIDWDNSWVAEEKYRKTYWDEILPGRVFRAARRAVTLDEWWSSPALRNLGVQHPRYQDRRLELAELLREPPVPVLRMFQNSLPALLLRVRIIAEAVADDRKARKS